MQPLRDWEGEWGECIRQRGVGRALVQKVLKTASKYAENGDLFTRIQVKRIRKINETILAQQKIKKRLRDIAKLKIREIL